MTDRELWVIEVGDRAALRTQYRPRFVGGAFDIQWFRGLQWRRYH